MYSLGLVHHSLKHEMLDMRLIEKFTFVLFSDQTYSLQWTRFFSLVPLLSLSFFFLFCVSRRRMRRRERKKEQNFSCCSISTSFFSLSTFSIACVEHEQRPGGFFFSAIKQKVSYTHAHVCQTLISSIKRIIVIACVSNCNYFIDTIC